MSLKDNIELYDIYRNNMTVARYTELLPQIQQEINKSDAPFTCFMHDNAWRAGQPRAELNRCFGEGRWTQYMGDPCKKPHKTLRTHHGQRPALVDKLRCGCEFPEGPIHAAYNPKINLVEETFAEMDRQMLKNQRADSLNNKPWPMKGVGKEKFWRKQLKKAVNQLNKRPHVFRNQYAGFKGRCEAFIKSRGKRLKTSKW